MPTSDTATIGGLSQDEVMALLEVHSQRIVIGVWPDRMHIERVQPNRTRTFQGLIHKGILDNPDTDDVVRITPEGRNTLYAVCEVLTNSI